MITRQQADDAADILNQWSWEQMHGQDKAMQHGWYNKEMAIVITRKPRVAKVLKLLLKITAKSWWTEKPHRSAQ